MLHPFQHPILSSRLLFSASWFYFYFALWLCHLMTYDIIMTIFKRTNARNQKIKILSETRLAHSFIHLFNWLSWFRYSFFFTFFSCFQCVGTVKNSSFSRCYILLHYKTFTRHWRYSQNHSKLTLVLRWWDLTTTENNISFTTWYMSR